MAEEIAAREKAQEEAKVKAEQEARAREEAKKQAEERQAATLAAMRASLGGSKKDTSDEEVTAFCGGEKRQQSRS